MRVAPERSTVTFANAFKTMLTAAATPCLFTVGSMSRHEGALRQNPQVMVDTLPQARLFRGCGQCRATLDHDLRPALQQDPRPPSGFTRRRMNLFLNDGATGSQRQRHPGCAPPGPE